MHIQKIKLMLLGATALVVASCTVSKTPMPELIGPSELSLSLAVTANPDLITANGAAQSTIRVIARDAVGQPQANVDLRVDTVTAGDVIVEIGQLSQHAIKTDSKGEATLTFTAPMAANTGIDDTPPVTVRFLPVSTDFALQMPRYVVIRLVPPAVIVVPGAPIPDFSFLPATPAVNEIVNFNAAASTDPDGIASYTWDWGDGEAATKTTPGENHDFAAAGTYIVTLTVVDNTGQRSSKSKQVVVH